jgi:hypothetical protein
VDEGTQPNYRRSQKRAPSVRFYPLEGFRVELKTDASKIFKWDFTYNDIEVFNSRWVHLGSMDPETGAMMKPPVTGRTQNV